MFSYYHHTVSRDVLESLFTFCLAKEETYIFSLEFSTLLELDQYKCKQDGRKALKREILNTSGI